jgi:hypothetical protein
VRRSWQVAGLLSAGVFAFGSITSLEYSLFDRLGPGAGFFPFWLSVLGLGLSGAVVAHATWGPALEGDPVPLLPESTAARRLAAILVAVSLAALLFEALGFRLTVLLFVAGLLLALGARAPWPIAIAAAVGSFGVFHVFHHWLRLPLPIGWLGV